MSWGQRRKLIYIGSVIIIFLIIIFWIFISFFYKIPTCFDSKQNQDEQGIDCGGSCNLLCVSQYAPLIVKWQRFSKVSDGVFNVLAYIENPNLNARANNLNYIFKLYDKNGVLLRERTGQTFAPANKIMAIFEPDLQTGNQLPARVEFSFTSPAVWIKQESMETGLAVSQIILSKEDSTPRLSFVLTNKTVKEIKEIEAIGIVYNVLGNTVAFSKTFTNSLFDNENRLISFNWPKPFSEAYARSEIILKVLK